MLLAAGLGSRLRPLTDVTPKCLLPVRGQPLLGLWLRHLERQGWQEVVINTHHLSDQVDRFVGAYNGPLRVRTVYEPELLGSAGTLRENRELFSRGDPVLVCNADNLTSVDLRALWSQHVAAGRPFTMGLFRAGGWHDVGVVEVDGDRVVGFEEKPRRPTGTWANAGIYVLEGQVVDLLGEGKPLDIAQDLVPAWIGRMTGVPVIGYVRDIGTFESYAAAEEEWPG